MQPSLKTEPNPHFNQQSFPSAVPFLEAWNNKRHELDQLRYRGMFDEAYNSGVSFLASSADKEGPSKVAWSDAVSYCAKLASFVNRRIDERFVVSLNQELQAPDSQLNIVEKVTYQARLNQYLAVFNSGSAQLTQAMQSLYEQAHLISPQEDPTCKVRENTSRSLLISAIQFKAKFGFNKNVEYIAKIAQRWLGQRYPSESLYLFAAYKAAANNYRDCKKANWFLDTALAKVDRDRLRGQNQEHCLKERILEEQIKNNLRLYKSSKTKGVGSELNNIEGQALKLLTHLKAHGAGDQEGPAPLRNIFRRIVRYLAEVYLLQGRSGLAKTLMEDSSLVSATGPHADNARAILSQASK